MTTNQTAKVMGKIKLVKSVRAVIVPEEILGFLIKFDYSCDRLSSAIHFRFENNNSFIQNYMVGTLGNFQNNIFERLIHLHCKYNVYSDNCKSMQSSSLLQ